MQVSTIHIMKVRDDLEYFYHQTCEGTKQEFSEMFQFLMTDRKLRGAPRTMPLRLVVHLAIIISNRLKCLRTSEDKKAMLRPALMRQKEIDRYLQTHRSRNDKYISRRLFKMLNTKFMFNEINL